MKRVIASIICGILIFCSPINVKAYDYTEEDIKLIAQLTFAEAEAESELGQRLVIDTVLNRVDSETFPSTPREVIYQKGQYTCTTNGRFNKSKATDELVELVEGEIEQRYSDKALFFARKKHGFGEYLIHVGNHHFSTLKGV